MSDRRLNIIMAIVITVCCLVGGCLGYFLLSSEYASDEVIDQEKERLYELERTTTKDLETLMGTEGISIDISSSDKIQLTFSGTNCKLQVTYNKNYEILEEEFIDNRVPPIVDKILCVLLGLIAGAIVGIPLLWITLEIDLALITRKEKRKKAKIQKQEEKIRKKQEKEKRKQKNTEIKVIQL